MMMKHMSTAHIDEKPYKCDKCSEKFYDNDDLKIHLITHVGETRYQCDKCGKKFRRPVTLNSHGNSYTGNFQQK